MLCEQKLIMNIYFTPPSHLISVWVETETLSSVPTKSRWPGGGGRKFWNSWISSQTMTGFLTGRDLLIFTFDFSEGFCLTSGSSGLLNLTLGNARALPSSDSLVLLFPFFFHFFDLKILSSLDVMLCWCWLSIMLTSCDSRLSNVTTGPLSLYPAGMSVSGPANEILLTMSYTFWV